MLSGINVVAIAAACVVCCVLCFVFFCFCGINMKNTGGIIADVCKNVRPLHA